MKKHLFRSLVFIIAAGFAFSFASCSDNEDEEYIGTINDLIGTWSITRISGYEKENGVTTMNEDRSIPSELSGTAYIRFDSDGTFLSPLFGEADLEEGEWTLSGDKLTMTSYDLNNNPEEIVFTLDVLTTKKLVIYSYEDFTEDGVRYQGYLKLVAVKR